MGIPFQEINVWEEEPPLNEIVEILPAPYVLIKIPDFFCKTLSKN